MIFRITRWWESKDKYRKSQVFFVLLFVALFVGQVLMHYIALITHPDVPIIMCIAALVWLLK